jgi:hypothetical protein
MVGTHINRNITWADMAKPFMTYMTRVQYMLQQGDPTGDIAYLLPEGAPSTMPFWGDGLQPAVPAGYDFDVMNTDVLLNRTSVAADGRIHVEGTDLRAGPAEVAARRRLHPEERHHRGAVDGDYAAALAERAGADQECRLQGRRSEGAGVAA